MDPHGFGSSVPSTDHMSDQNEADAATARTEWGRTSPGQVYGEWAVRTLRDLGGSGALASGGAALALLSGGGAVLRGAWLRGFVRLVVGAVLLAVAVLQRTGAGRPRGEPIEVGTPEDADGDG